MSIDMSAAAHNKWLVSLEDPGGLLSDGILLLAHLVCIFNPSHVAILVSYATQRPFPGSK